MNGPPTVAIILRAEWVEDEGGAWIVGRLPSGRDILLMKAPSMLEAEWLIRDLSTAAKEREPDE